MIETAELLITSNDRETHDIPPTYTDMLITFYRKLDNQTKVKLRFLYPTITKELDEYTS